MEKIYKRDNLYKVDADVAKQKAIALLEQRRLDKYNDFHPDNPGGYYRFLQWKDPVFFTEGKRDVHEKIADAIQGVATGKIEYLLLSLPPRTGKSYIVSLLSALSLGYFPDESIMRNSATMDLASIFSKDIRGFIESDWYRKIFKGVSLNKRNKSVGNWSINDRTRPTYSCAGIGGNSTGKGYNLFGIIDDSISDYSDCTPGNLETQWLWFQSVMRTRREWNERLGRKAGLIVIGTRWHREDIIGKLLATEGDRWTNIEIPALVPNVDAKDARSFCEEIYTTDELKDMVKSARATGTLFSFMALYQQRPTDLEGSLFAENLLKTFSMQDLEGRVYVKTTFHIDFANKGKDFFSMPIVSEYERNNGAGGTDKYLVDCIFDQSDITITLPKVIEKIKKYMPSQINIEVNNGGDVFVQNLKDEIEKLDIPIKPRITENFQTRNKETKILASVGDIIENIHFLLDNERHPEYNAFMLNLTTYSKSGRNEHDDAPDSLADLMRILKVSGVRIILL